MSTTKLMASRSRCGSRLVTYVPSPRRTSSTRMTSSAFTASRMELRDRPSRSASSFSGGSRSPGPSSPEMIIALIFWIASSVTAMATSSHIGRMSAVGVCDDGGMRVLDAHLHLWDPAVLEYDWLEGPLARRFAEEEFAEEQLIG